MLAAVWGAGTLALGGREPLALRSALGFVVWGQALFALAAVGGLGTAPVVALLIVAIAGGAMRTRFAATISYRWLFAFAAIGTPMFVLALHPPLAFDETLYHLPIVRSFAETGELTFLAQLRFPVFPVLHELLCVPVYRVAGDAAPHLVSLAEVVVTAALVAEWARRYAERAAPIAAALFIGSPIVIHLGTIAYVEAALALFVAAGFYALDVALKESRRGPLILSGLFFGAACSVKYLGWFFTVAALVIVFLMRRRDTLLFALATGAAALPTTLWIALNTGNPVFPFVPRLFGPSEWTLPPVAVRSASDMLRVVWDVTFARERINFQPPMTPLLIALVLLVSAAAVRNMYARILMVLAGTYLCAFAFLPQDSRYLVPLLPLFCVCAAVIVAKRVPHAAATATFVAILPALGYLVWRFAVMGVPPVDAQSREAMLAARIVGYEALQHAGDGRVYACGAEELMYFARVPLLGDYHGPFSRARVTAGVEDTATLATRLRAIGIEYFLVNRRRCEPRRVNGGLALVYEDAGAQLWRLESPR